MVAYTNINTSESLGASVNTALKGGFQFTAATVDKALGSDMGATDLVVAVLLVALAVMIIAYIARGKRAIESVF